MEAIITTPIFKVHYPHLDKPHAAQEGAKEKYSVTMLFPKDTDMSKIKELIQNAIASRWDARKRKGIKIPVRDGDKDRPDKPEFKNCYFINASSLYVPKLYDQNKNEATHEIFYAGCFAVASIKAFAYEAPGNKGVSIGLNKMMKIKDGEKIFKERDDFAEYTPTTASQETKMQEHQTIKDAKKIFNPSEIKVEGQLKETDSFDDIPF
jgi:hypothetical protein